MACGRQFRSGSSIDAQTIWGEYLEGKQTISELATSHKLSPSTIKRKLHEIRIDWNQPEVKGSGVVHLDASYFDRNSGILLALEAGSGRLLYMKHIAHEHISDYEEAVRCLERSGYDIKGIVLDGNVELFNRLSRYPIQMCQFHFVAIIRRKLTKNPKLDAGRELLDLVYSLKSSSSEEFTKRFDQWDSKWKSFLREKTINATTGEGVFTHKRLRSARLTARRFIPWLFTFQDIKDMPNTNNLIEGTFTDVKKNLRIHPGMLIGNRIRFINGFFLAYENKHNKKGKQ